MKLTKRTFPEFEEAIREVLGRFDMELLYDKRIFMTQTAGGAFEIQFIPFADHKPFYRGQK